MGRCVDITLLLETASSSLNVSHSAGSSKPPATDFLLHFITSTQTQICCRRSAGMSCLVSLYSAFGTQSRSNAPQMRRSLTSRICLRNHTSGFSRIVAESSPCGRCLFRSSGALVGLFPSTPSENNALSAVCWTISPNRHASAAMSQSRLARRSLWNPGDTHRVFSDAPCPEGGRV